MKSIRLIFLLFPLMALPACEDMASVLFLSPGGNHSQASLTDNGFFYKEDPYEPNDSQWGYYDFGWYSDNSLSGMRITFHTATENDLPTEQTYDQDWFKFQATSTGNMDIGCETLSGTYSQVAIELYNENGNLLADNDGGMINNILAPCTNGQFYVVSFKPGGSYPGLYQIKFNKY